MRGTIKQIHVGFRSAPFDAAQYSSALRRAVRDISHLFINDIEGTVEGQKCILYLCANMILMTYACLCFHDTVETGNTPI